MRSRFTAFSILLLVLVATPREAFAGAPHMDCAQPFIYPDADVNVVVLPYKYAGADQKLNETGRRISLLIQADTLLHILPYGSVASVQLEPGEGREAECEPGIVLQKLTGKISNYPQLKSGHGLVLIWGLLYEEAGDVYLKTFATALRRDAQDSAELKFGKWAFLTSPSSRVLSFAPRKISRAMLDDIERTYSGADKVYAEPNDGASSRALPRASCPTCSPGETQGYYVDKKQGDWLHVRWFGANEARDAGWIRAQANLAGHSLDSFMPELNYVRGTVGYLRMRMAPGTSDAGAMRELAKTDFRRFLDSNQGGQTELSTAVALQLCGIMQVLGGGTPQDWSEAIKYFEQAREMLPESPEARNTSAVGHIYQDWLSGDQLTRSKDRAQELIHATLLKPNDPVPLNNLQSYYQLVLPKARAAGANIPGTALSASEIQKRLDKIEYVRNPAKQRPTPVQTNNSPY